MNNDIENNKKRIKRQFDYLIPIVGHRYNSVSTIAGVSAALLVIATFNERIVPFNQGVKIVIIILLLMIPISVFLHLYQLNQDYNGINKKIADIVKETTGGQVPELPRKTLWERALYRYPEIATSIILLIIIFIVGAMNSAS